MSFRVTGLKELERGFTKLGAATARGEARAVNRVSTTIIAQQSRAVVARINLRVGRVKEAVRLRQKATPDQPRIVIEVQRRAVGLIEFGGRWRGTKSEGASALVIRGKGRHIYAGTFIAIGRNGNRQIFDRKVVGGKRAPRLPLKTLYGPSVYSQFLRDDIQRVGSDTWAIRLPIELDRETRFALKQSGLS
jgi:hypothetical protein